MYRYELWYDGCCIHEESGFDSYDEALMEAESYRNYDAAQIECVNETEDYEIRIEEE